MNLKEHIEILKELAKSDPLFAAYARLVLWFFKEHYNDLDFEANTDGFTDKEGNKLTVEQFFKEIEPVPFVQAATNWAKNKRVEKKIQGLIQPEEAKPKC